MNSHHPQVEDGAGRLDVSPGRPARAGSSHTFFRSSYEDNWPVRVRPI